MRERKRGMREREREGIEGFREREREREALVDLAGVTVEGQDISAGSSCLCKAIRELNQQLP